MLFLSARALFFSPSEKSSFYFYILNCFLNLTIPVSVRFCCSPLRGIDLQFEGSLSFSIEREIKKKQSEKERVEAVLDSRYSGASLWMCALKHSRESNQCQVGFENIFRTRCAIKLTPCEPKKPPRPLKFIFSWDANDAQRLFLALIPNCNISRFSVFQGRCNREKPPCKYFHPPQHLKDQLLINGRNHLALKNALMQQMGMAPPTPTPTILQSPLQPMVSNLRLLNVYSSPCSMLRIHKKLFLSIITFVFRGFLLPQFRISVSPREPFSAPLGT